MKPWLGRNNAGQHIGIIYYGFMGWVSRCTWIIPGTEGEELPSLIQRAGAVGKFYGHGDVA